MTSLTAVDIIVLLLVGGGAVLGVLRGFVTEVISLFAWVAAVVALKFFFEPTTDFLMGWIGTEAGAAILAFVLVFGIVFVTGKLIAASLGGRVRNSILGPMDRLLGLGFGTLKGLVIASVAYLLFTIAYETVVGGDEERPQWLVKSHSHVLLDASSRAIVDFVEERRGGG